MMNRQLISQSVVAVAAILLALHAPRADAQASPTPDATPQVGPVVGGKDIQPHAAENIPGGQTDAEATELLRETNDAGPVVPPHDLYGNPLGVDTHNITTDPGKRQPPPASPSH